MKKSLNKSIVLFGLRLLLYFSVIMLIFVHPGISIYFDRIGIIQWFIIIPLMTVIAFIPEHKIKMRIKRIVSLSLLFLLSLIAGAPAFGALQLFAAGLISFTLTHLLFNRTMVHERFAKITALEPFFLAWVCLRLLSLSRSSEAIAEQSMVLTQFILVWTAVVFLLHSIIIYLCLYPQSRPKVWKEGFVFFGGALAMLFVLLAVLPPDFVSNAIIENLVTDRMPQRIQPSDTDHRFPQRGNGRRTLPSDGSGRGELRGLSEHDWPGRGAGSSESRQYMVKIVASEREPVYMCESFRGQLDPVFGFLLSPNEPMNDLVRQRFFVTWDNEREFVFDLGRERQEIFSLSTLRQKYLPYRPVVIDPTILSEDSGPLRYIHQVVSNTHLGDPLLLVYTKTRPFTEFEKFALTHYLELPLEDDDIKVFEAHVNKVLREWQNNREAIIESDSLLMEIFSDKHGNEDTDNTSDSNVYLETIIALLVGFSDFQYNLTPINNYSVAMLKEFIFDTKEGDCVAFSNSLALLGRVAGIPSRVVTGYLAAEGLQTPAHLRGLAMLRSRIPFLQRFPFDNLFMVTNLHSHSWTQFYIPDYGWLDFEATSFSLPPEGVGDFNNWDVVIPILDQTRTFSQVRKFPWQAVGRTLAALVVFALIGAYVLRYGRELILYFGTRRGGKECTSIRACARSLYLFLLARLAADGQPIKPASKTAHEYADLFAREEECFIRFASIYSELRWKNFEDSAQMDERFAELRQEYRNIINTTRRPGIHRGIIRIFSLRGLAYL